MTPTMTRWQCEFVRRGRSIRWVVMAFGESSARTKADAKLTALGKGWHLDKVTQVREDAA